MGLLVLGGVWVALLRANPTMLPDPPRVGEPIADVVLRLGEPDRRWMESGMSWMVWRIFHDGIYMIWRVRVVDGTVADVELMSR